MVHQILIFETGYSDCCISFDTIYCNSYRYQQWMTWTYETILESKKQYSDIYIYIYHLHLSSHSLNPDGHWGTTDDVATIPFHPSLSSAALRETPNSMSVHSLILSSHLFFCLPLLLAPFTVPCKIVFVMPQDLELWPYHLTFHFFTMVRRASCTPIAFWILLRTSSFVAWSFLEMFRSLL